MHERFVQVNSNDIHTFASEENVSLPYLCSCKYWSVFCVFWQWVRITTFFLSIRLYFMGCEDFLILNDSPFRLVMWWSFWTQFLPTWSTQHFHLNQTLATINIESSPAGYDEEQQKWTAFPYACYWTYQTLYGSLGPRNVLP